MAITIQGGSMENCGEVYGVFEGQFNGMYFEGCTLIPKVDGAFVNCAIFGKNTIDCRHQPRGLRALHWGFKDCQFGPGLSWKNCPTLRDFKAE
ncbi:hypothetical protein [Cupriavidus campinensis]|uniref:hypothetical protein n=1 Tax=Cupriavidus campinensis TaxID=151783 RepID=UPI0024E21818|nr:hypothetical protein [Cupriavidus campinensis]